jgi:hypothetical protein
MPSIGPLLDNADVVEATFVGSFQGSTILNVWHFNAQLDVALVDSGAWFDGLLNALQQDYWQGAGMMKSLVSTDYTLLEIRAQVVWPTRRFYLKKAINEQGTKIGAAMPSDTHLEVALRTNAVGRGKTGNKKFTGLVAAEFLGPVWLPATVAAWQAFGDEMLFTIQPLIADANKVAVPIVWSRKRSADRRNIIATTAREEVRVEPSRRLFQGI